MNTVQDVSVCPGNSTDRVRSGYLTLPGNLLGRLDAPHSGRPHVLLCKHLADGSCRKAAGWSFGKRFTREDGTEGRVAFVIACARCTGKAVDYIEFFWADRKFHCCDTHQEVLSEGRR